MNTEAPLETLAKTRSSVEGVGRGQSRSSLSHWRCLGDGQSAAWSPQPLRQGKSGALVRVGAAAPSALAPRNLILAGGLGVGARLRGVVLKHFGVLQHLSDQGRHRARNLHLQGNGPFRSCNGGTRRFGGAEVQPLRLTP